MKRAAIIIAMLGTAVWSFAQDKPAGQSAPAGQPAGQAGTPAGKRPPQAKTQPEFDAYKGGSADRCSGAGEGRGGLCYEVSGERIAATALQGGDARLPTG